MALGTISKSLERGLEELEIGEWIETIQTTALLKSTRIRRRVLGDVQRLPITKTQVKYPQEKLVWRTQKDCDLARELKNLWNMKVTIIPIVIGAFGTVTKWLLKGLEDLEVGGRVETIQTTALLKKISILRRALETWQDLLSLKLQWKPIS